MLHATVPNGNKVRKVSVRENLPGLDLGAVHFPLAFGYQVNVVHRIHRLPPSTKSLSPAKMAASPELSNTTPILPAQAHFYFKKRCHSETPQPCGHFVLKMNTLQKAS